MYEGKCGMYGHFAASHYNNCRYFPYANCFSTQTLFSNMSSIGFLLLAMQTFEYLYPATNYLILNVCMILLYTNMQHHRCSIDLINCDSHQMPLAK